MLETFLSILPLSIAAAISVTSILIFFALIVTGQNQVKNGFAFIIGGLVIYVILTFIIIFSVRKSSPGSTPNYTLDAIIDFVLAGICLLLLVNILFHWNKPHVEKQNHKQGGVTTYFILGALTKLVSVNTLPPFIGAVKDISAANLSFATEIIMCTIVILIAMLTIIIPFSLFLFNKKKALIIIAPMSVFLKKNKNMINAMLLGLIVLYMSFHGYCHLNHIK